MKRNPMTLRGAELLRAELKKLRSEERPAVIKAIAEARGHGDLSENAEYHAAREQQGFIEGRIADIESKLSTADIIDVSSLSPAGRVVFGATVELADENDGKHATYTIVGEDEADIRAGRIAYNPGREPQLRDRHDPLLTLRPRGRPEGVIPGRAIRCAVGRVAADKIPPHVRSGSRGCCPCAQRATRDRLLGQHDPPRKTAP